METYLSKFVYGWRGNDCTVYAVDLNSADAIMAKVMTKVDPVEGVEYCEARGEYVYFQTK